MSFIVSRALVEESLQVNCGEIDAYAPSNLIPTPEPFSSRDKTTESFGLSQYGMTLEALTEGLYAELLMSWLAAFPAMTLVPLEPALVSTASTAACGPRWPALFARFNPVESKWKTVQCSLLGDSDEFSETWPRWGSMLNGECYLRPMPALPICESASGFWQTPVADDAIERKAGKWNSRGEPKLSAQVKLAPTPTASDTGFRKEKYAQGGTALSTFVGGHLNPDWEEWLMGWPIGWTALEPLEWGKYREWQSQHSPSFPIEAAA